MVRWRKDRELHWRGVLERQAKSGLSVAEFCRQESLSVPSFYAWRRNLRDREIASCETDIASEEPQFVPVHITPSRSVSPIRIVLPQGISVETSSAMDQEVLVSMLRALGGSFSC